jgi:phosphoribosyl 1,2-cyclic phosphate phosphodiesterase
MKGQFLFLGTGASMGIPVIGCHCKVCKSESPCNQRMRPSGLLSIDGKKILVDCGPDFRIQALKYHIEHLDGLILTHAHHDHLAGVDDLRVYSMHNKESLPCLLSQETAKNLKHRYHYFFDEIGEKLVARMDLKVIEHERGKVNFLDIPISYLSYEQMGMKVNGFRFGDFAYISDIRDYPNTIFQDLNGIKTLVVSALRMTPSRMHFSVDEAMEFVRLVGAEEAWLTHISHDLDHEETNAYLPPHIRMAYDGLQLNFRSR